MTSYSTGGLCSYFMRAHHFVVNDFVALLEEGLLAVGELLHEFRLTFPGFSASLLFELSVGFRGRLHPFLNLGRPD